MKVTVAATQMACSESIAENLEKAEGLVRQAAAAGANIVLLQEMFSTRFLGMLDWDPKYFCFAETTEESRVIKHMASLAKELGVVIPVNFFERTNQAYFNTIMMIDADGTQLGIYRKSHIPEGPPHCFEKYFTSPGNTGFKAWDTTFGKLGVGICWDQWFPESARCMAVQGAEILFYPTAIGSDCHDHWQRVMQGHAGANLTPLITSNRVGSESGPIGTTNFWGSSFIADQTGAIVAKAGTDKDEVVTATFDMAAIRQQRAGWAMFRDRRPDLYGPLLTLDGETPVKG